MKKERKKRSPIWLLPDEQFIELIQNSKSYASILKYFGFQNKGSNFETVKQRIKKLNLSTDHFELQNHACNLKITIPLEQILIENSTYTNMWRLKKRLFSTNLLTEQCSECGIKNSWNGKSLSLTLDHINGISNDNRIENLRILCPNCHSQTETFAGRNKQY